MTVDASRTFYGSNINNSSLSQQFASDIGLVSFVHHEASSGCATRHAAMTRTYARVGGVTYGVPF